MLILKKLSSCKGFGMKNIFLSLIWFVLTHLQLVHCDLTTIYDTDSKNGGGFKDWVIKEIPENDFQVDRRVQHNGTKQLDITPTDRVNFSDVRAYSPLINVHPAWEIFVTADVETNGTGLSNEKDCKVKGNDCVELRIKSFRKKEENITQKLYKGGTSFTESFTSGHQYPEKLDNEIGTYKYVQFEFKLIFYYPFNNPPLENFKSVSITRFKVTYYNCPAVVHGLAVYVNEAASREESKSVRQEGKCVENAAKRDLKEKLWRYCDWKAKAKFVGNCTCLKGFEQRRNKCIPCAEDHFRDNIYSGRCARCGNNTNVIDRRTVCQCKQMFYRLPEEQNQNTKNCYAYPNPPDGIKTDTFKNHTISLKWLHQITTELRKNLGNFPVSYTIKCVNHNSMEVCQQRRSTNRTIRTAKLSFNIRNVLPYTIYLFEICSHTTVSLKNNHEHENCKQTRVRTRVGLPTKVIGLQANVEKGGVLLDWQHPIAKGSATIEYHVTCANQSRVLQGEYTSVFMNTGTKTGEVNCLVRAKSSEGFGPVVTKRVKLVGNKEKDGKSVTPAIIGGCIGVLVVLIIGGVIGFRLFRNKKRDQNALVSAIKTIMSIKENEIYGQNVRRELEQRMRNIYVPLDVLLSQSVVELGGEEPIYEEVPPRGYDYPFRSLKKIQDLGEGNFAIVSQCEAMDICGRLGRSLVAVKQLKDDCNEADEMDFEGELQLMQEFKYHPNVVKLLGICTYPRCMIVEYLPGGDLLSFLVRSRKYQDSEGEDAYGTVTAEGSFLTAADLLEFAHQITKGMAHVAKCRVVHRDLACRNILVGYNRVCKIADFGLARKLNDNGIYRREKQAKLPVKWLPPESIHYGRSTIKSDVWSFGVVLWEIVTVGALPYPGRKSKEIPDLLKQGYRMEKPEHCSNELYDIMMECWAEDDENRPSFLEVSSAIETLQNGMSSYINLNVYSDDSYLKFNGNEIDEEEIVVDPYSF